VLFAALEAGAYQQVAAGTPADPHFPPGFTQPGTGPIPAIVSQSLVDSPRGVKVGDVFSMSVEGYTLQYRAVEARDSFPGLPIGRRFFVVASRDWFRAQAPASRILPIVMFARAPDGPQAAAAIRAAAASRAPTVDVTLASEQAAALRASPVTNAVRSGILVAALVTAAYAALGVAAALALAGIARTVETARLRTLGLTARQAFTLVFAEHGPTTIAAFVVGGLLGVGLFVLMRSSLGLADLVGSPVDVPVSLDARALLLILAGMVVVVGVGLLLGATLQRRVAPAAALRGRFE
jgi:predicted lysophospholipase L1 biosynthesis ABC-type transport system permease subunit